MPLLSVQLHYLSFFQHDLTRVFQKDDITSAMELTKCFTSTLPSLRERLNEMTRSKNLADDVAIALAQNKNSQHQTSPTVTGTKNEPVLQETDEAAQVSSKGKSGKFIYLSCNLKFSVCIIVCTTNTKRSR